MIQKEKRWIIEVSFNGVDWTQNNNVWYVHIEPAKRELVLSRKEYPENQYRIVEFLMEGKILDI